MTISFIQQNRSSHNVRLSNDVHLDQIKVGDFNGDRNMDLVFSEIHLDLGTTPSPFIFMLGDGSGNFRDVSATLFPNGLQYGNFTARMEVADINGDGISDIFGIDNGEDKQPFAGGFNELFLSNGRGGMTNASSLLPMMKLNNHGASVGDVNNDGKLDLLVNDVKDVGSLLWIQGTDGKFANSPRLMPDLMIYENNGTYIHPRTSPYSALIDVNQDGYLDMILGGWHQNIKGSEVYLNKGGSFSQSTPIKLPISGISEESILDIEAIDLNGDKLPDLAISVTDGHGNSYYEVKKIQLLVNKGNGVFEDQTQQRLQSPANSFNSWYKSIDVVDLNKDGAMDLVGHSYGTPDIFMNDGKGFFSKSNVTDWENRVYSTTDLGDFNKDGLPDMVLAVNNLYFDTWLNTSSNSHIYKANFGGEELLGSHGNDRFIHTSGHSKFSGNGGIDSVQVDIKKDQATLTQSSNKAVISQKGVSHNKLELTDIYRIQFSDQGVATDISGNAGKAAKILGAVFGKDAVQNKGYVGIVLGLLDSGVGYETLLQMALNVRLGDQASNSAVVDLLWTNLMGSPPAAGATVGLVQQMNEGIMSPTALGMLVAESDLNLKNIDLVGLAQTGLGYTAFG